MLNRILKRIRKSRRVAARRMRFKNILRAFSEKYSDVFFIQIGSNDADYGDPLQEFVRGQNWSGIMVEPVQYIFTRLVRKYGDNAKLILENVAIAHEDGLLDFFHLAESHDHLPRWYDQLGSFSIDTILQHSKEIPDIRQRIVKVKVPCITFNSLCEKHKVERIDLLQIDTEGYDYEIIKLVDFSHLKPHLIIYENNHLNETDKLDCMKYLNLKGFDILENGSDAICLLFEDLEPENSNLSRVWRAAKAETRDLCHKYR